MNADSPPPAPKPGDSHEGAERYYEVHGSSPDSNGRMVDWSYAADRPRALNPCGQNVAGEELMTTYTYRVQVWPLAFAFEHDNEKGVFRLTGEDGKTEVFRDNPVRYLVVKPDLETGELKPATKYGKPTYLYLCREEHEKG